MVYNHVSFTNHINGILRLYLKINTNKSGFFKVVNSISTIANNNLEIPPNTFYPKSYFFCDLKLCAKFQNPRTTPSGKKYVARGGKREKNNNNPKNSGHYILLQGPRAAHALRSDQNNSKWNI